MALELDDSKAVYGGGEPGRRAIAGGASSRRKADPPGHPHDDYELAVLAPAASMTTNAEHVIGVTSRWVERVVIGLNLCPFAKAVQVKGQLRYVVSKATTTEALRQDLEQELGFLAATPPSEVDTTLLIHPSVLGEFLDYNDFLSDADTLLSELELEGELQIASFHPGYCFADAVPDDAANYTNRSPYPMLHLLREQSVSRAVDAFPDTASIFERNIATLRELSPNELAQLLSEEE